MLEPRREAFEKCLTPRTKDDGKADNIVTAVGFFIFRESTRARVL